MQNTRDADAKHIHWARNVKERDNYTCQICRAIGVRLHSHHLNSYDIFVDQRYILDNGITLCSVCHEKFHVIFGKGSNTKFQFEQFKKSRELILKALLNKYSQTKGSK